MRKNKIQTRSWVCEAKHGEKRRDLEGLASCRHLQDEHAAEKLLLNVEAERTWSKKEAPHLNSEINRKENQKVSEHRNSNSVSSSRHFGTGSKRRTRPWGRKTKTQGDHLDIRLEAAQYASTKHF